MLEDIGIYELDTDTVEHVYRIRGVECSTSQLVGVETVEGRCLVLIGRSCTDEICDVHICESLTRLFPSAVSRAELMIIFTATIPQLEALYPARPTHAGGSAASQDAAAEDDMSWLDNKQVPANSPVTTPLSLARSTGLVASERPVATAAPIAASGKRTLTIEAEFNNMLARDTDHLITAAESRALDVASFQSPRQTSTNSLNGSFELMCLDAQPVRSSQRTEAGFRRRPLLVSSTSARVSMPETAIDHGQEYNGIMGEIFVRCLHSLAVIVC